MEPEINAELPAGEPTAIAPAPAKDGPVSLTDAMRSVVDWPRKQTAGDRRQTTDSSEAGAGNATPEPTESRKGRRRSSPRSFTTSTSTCSKRRSMNSRRTPRRVWID